ncbi:MAG TPA: hypothetical protein ENF27_03590 [Chloroflexi bacterium]|nr:MAG: hypothetical protein DRI65_02180 [Chloroflexota bacterium]HDN05000.1 hypothetical protein [Chloroflexota bacterium]
MINQTVPPSFDLEETSFVSFVGIGLREVVIVGGGLLLGIVIGVAVPWGWPIKIGLGTLFAAFGLWLAIGREPGSNRKFEEVILDYLRFQRRPKVHQRHFMDQPEEGDPFSTPDVFEGLEETRTVREAEIAWDVSQLPSLEQINRAQGWFKIRSIPLTGATLLNILGLALIAGILTWVWTGGLKSLLSGFTGF